jgi:predicted nucleotidyltransferase
MSVFQEDFRDFLQALSDHRVEFMLIGGYAYNLHVQARVTQDIDVWVRPSADNLERLSDALRTFADAEIDLSALGDLLKSSKLGFGLGIEPNRIEVLLRVNGVTFDDAYPRALEVEVDEVRFKVIHPHDQIRNKRAAGRLKDLADVQMLVKLHGEPQD